MKSPLYLVAALAIAASAACAPTASTQTASAAAPADRDCFNTNFVSGFSAVDKDTVKLEAGPRKDYEVDITGPGCDNVTWTMSVFFNIYTTSIRNSFGNTISRIIIYFGYFPRGVNYFSLMI